MREIKFRMWDGKEKKYYYDIETVWSCLKQQKQGIYDHIADGCVFEQYTGRKDKNGKEIYEGDIVSITNTDDDNEILSEVTWGGEDYPAFDLSNYDGYGMNGFSAIYHSSIGEKIEILGNIHKNPKLLEVLE